MKDEIERRRRYLDNLANHFKAHPHEWIPAQELARVAGGLAWRTRISDCRLVLKMNIEWNNQSKASAYRYVPYERLASRDSTVPGGSLNRTLF